MEEGLWVGCVYACGYHSLDQKTGEESAGEQKLGLGGWNPMGSLGTGFWCVRRLEVREETGVT